MTFTSILRSAWIREAVGRKCAMEHLTVALGELYGDRNRSPLQRVRRSPVSSIKSCTGEAHSHITTAGSDYSGYHESVVYACKKAERAVRLPLVTKTCKCAGKDINGKIDESKYDLDVPRQRSGSELVIVQLFAEKYDGVRQNAEFSLRPPRSAGMSSPQNSPFQQRRQIQRNGTKPLADNLLIPNLLRTTPQLAEKKRQHKPEVACASGFTQAELKIHTDREKQKSNLHKLGEQERSKRIVEEWLKTFSR